MYSFRLCKINCFYEYAIVLFIENCSINIVRCRYLCGMFGLASKFHNWIYSQLTSLIKLTRMLLIEPQIMKHLTWHYDTTCCYWPKLLIDSLILHYVLFVYFENSLCKWNALINKLSNVWNISARVCPNMTQSFFFNNINSDNILFSSILNCN